MAEKKDETKNTQENQVNPEENKTESPKPEENTNGTPAPEPKMSKVDGFFVRHAESLDKWSGRLLKGFGIIAGGAAAFGLGMLVGKGSATDDTVDVGGGPSEGSFSSYGGDDTFNG